MRSILLALIVFSQSAVCLGETLLPELLEGANRQLPQDIPLADLLSRRWDAGERVFVQRSAAEPIEKGVFVTSCIELETAAKNGRFAIDSAQMGAEFSMREYCQNIKRLMRARAATQSNLALSICLDREIYIKLTEALTHLWRPAGLESVVLTSCKRSMTNAVVKYKQIIEPANEWHKGLSAGRVSIRYLVQGDFDGDGYLDVIAEVASELVFPDRVWYRSGQTAVVKISNTGEAIKVSKFSDL